MTALVKGGWPGGPPTAAVSTKELTGPMETFPAKQAMR
jgi:hypothetical protein